MHIFKQFFTFKISHLLCLLAISLWWVVPLWMIGVFDDGVFYSCIARNLVYDAQATIWDLKVSNALDPAFNGHPPLAFWLQGVFFWLVGDFYWVERVYSLICALLTVLLIQKSWRVWNEESSALPILFWLCIPVVGWSYGNNMLENTMTVFGTAAVYFLLKTANRGWYFSSALLIASFLISCGLLVKGFVGLYPLVTLAIYALINDRNNLFKSIGGSVILLLLVVSEFGLLFYFDERGLVYFNRYMELQFYPSMSGSNNAGANHFLLLEYLVVELLLVGGIVAGGKLLFAKLSPPTASIQWKQVFFWLLMAFSASLPILISPKQARFYLIPSMVFYSLSLATLFLPTFRAFCQYFLPFQKLKLATTLLLCLGITCCLALSYFNTKKYVFHSYMFSDIFKLGAVIPNHTEIYLSPSLYTEWSLHAYMYRYFYIDLSTVQNKQRFAVFSKKEVCFLSPQKYQEKELDLKVYSLYVLKK